MPEWYDAVHSYAGTLYASVLLITVIFLIARIGKVSQPTALALALSPMAFALAFDKAILPAIL
jgi:hypothetical protein